MTRVGLGRKCNKAECISPGMMLQSEEERGRVHCCTNVTL